MVTFGPVELGALGAAILAAMAETLHARRGGRIARLAFGPDRRPAFWARFAPSIRVLAVGSAAWGFGTLLTLPPKLHKADALPDSQRRHVVVVLDVSPSMRLRDAGPNADQSRMNRAADLMNSFLRRIPVEMYLLSVVACYNGAKPVVVDTKDLEVVHNIFGDLPLQYAFTAGRTDLFSGLDEAVKTARPWQPKSTLLLMFTDGDTVPAVGMPKLPASIADVLIVGVGDPRTGSFIDGRMSRQDAATLRQVAARLGGTYHDGNRKHLGSALLSSLTVIPRQSTFERLTRREYAILACALGSLALAVLPVLLHSFGTRWRPGVPPAALRGGAARGRPRSDSVSVSISMDRERERTLQS